MFGLDDSESQLVKKPSFRTLISYFARREESAAFLTPEKVSNPQKTGDFQKALMFLLHLDWQIASDWQAVRDQEKTLTELRKAAKGGTLQTIVGKAADLRTQLTVKQSQLTELKKQITAFRVLPEYRTLEKEADQITKELNDLANANTLDTALVRDLETALHIEAPPPIDDLEAVYSQAGIALPAMVMKRYDDVRKFHESVIRNRKDYLSGELAEAKQRIELREAQKEKLDHRRCEILTTLQTHGALDQFSRLQARATQLETEVSNLSQRYEAATLLESTKSKLTNERNKLNLRLQRDFEEQEIRLSEAILAYEKTSQSLYESAGSMSVASSTNGPEFSFPIQGGRSKGIKNMKIFCFDMMLMRLAINRGIGPGFLIH